MGFLRKVATSQELEELRTALKTQLPESLIVHGFIDIGCRFDLENYDVGVYVATESSIQSMVVVTPACNWKGVQSLTIYYKQEEKEEEEFAKLITSLPGLDWSKPVVLFSCSNYVITEFSNVVESGLIKTNLTPHYLYRAAAFILPEAKLPSSVRTPACGYIGSLKEVHAPLVSAGWVYNFLAQVEDIGKMITGAPSAAVFVDENGERKPVSWIRMHRHGEMGNTYTLPEYRRRGLASVVTLALAKKYIAAGLVPYCNIVESNTESVAFHTKLGFKRVMGTSAVAFVPPGVTLESLMSKQSHKL